jgi:hypothetical protein
LKQHPNAILIRDYLESVNRHLLAVENGTAPAEGYQNKYISDEVVAHYPGRSDIAGWYKGKDFFSKVVPRLIQYKATLLEVIDVLASDERAAVIVKERLEARDGRSIDFVRVAVYRIVDGLIAEMWVRDEDQYALDEFMAATKNLS